MKLGYSNNMSRPKFAIMNPKRTFTLPPYQTAAGVTDMMMHTMERYFTKDDDMDFTTDLAEAALRNIKDAVFAVLKNPEDYRYRAQIMWGGSLMHNGLTGCGVADDWARPTTGLPTSWSMSSAECSMSLMVQAWLPSGPVGLVM